MAWLGYQHFEAWVSGYREVQSSDESLKVNAFDLCLETSSPFNYSGAKFHHTESSPYLL